MLGIIAGSGLQRLTHLTNVRREIVRTPFGEASCALTIGQMGDVDVVFVNRHGYGHTLAPHQINYRANVWALQKIGVNTVCAIGSTGSLQVNITPGRLILPHDAIDYTSGRDGTYYEGPDQPIVYTDVAEPFSANVRQSLIQAANQVDETLLTEAVYGCTNGPRLETCAEVRRMVNDGADVVGMTLMQEAVLARELGLPYAALTVCTNYAAGIASKAANDLQQWRMLREQSLVRVENILLEWVRVVTS
ncbi:putative S-methyl-5'-thioinosine phosphorylase [Formosimonas limnophila]|uniref:Probable 6-oxopurine nucleoside phosphorylase n=1 Tax=Formosimonas limnophila TaxID=1384487 RepID=A0A8J3CI30_9BURK|nr:S-methyl-5'-thioinosine phosphorylase [Formosimonas limnophila]GHA74539.1 putative S-methyl-5'-thioinosine phosphorylase [Formosimonas limnophila]